MKKIYYLTLTITLILLMGCQNVENTVENEITSDNEAVLDYVPSSEDVISMHGDIDNIERFEAFFNHVEKGQKDNIRIVNYTTEGDPILQEVDYDGENIKVTTDSRRDSYGQGSISQNTCRKINVVEKLERTDYQLEGCKNQLDNMLLVIWKK
ncbi:hypothetical protein MTP04_05380 [Lysinibacillus sp. PLM2]|nr:hypothetical protein MTP04_05380 [Lysinibacillus sp. PLM2]